MALKTRISQHRQVRSSRLFDNIELGTDNADRNTLAEGQESIEQDLNVLRSLILEITGESLWSDAPSLSLKDSGDVANKLMLQPIQITLNDAGGDSKTTAIDVTPGVANTTGTTDLGYIVDDAANPSADSKAKILLRKKSTNAPLLDENEREIFAIGSNDDDKLKVTYYVDEGGDAIAVDLPPGDVEMILPLRTKFSDMNEDAILGNAAFSNGVGSLEIGDRVYEDVEDVFQFVQDENITNTINKLASVAGNDKLLSDNIASVSGITSKTYNTTFGTDGSTYLIDGDTLVQAAAKLDDAVVANNQAIEALQNTKAGVIVNANLAEDEDWTLPNSLTYAYTDTDAMQVHHNGVLLISDNLAGGDNKGDYAEIDATTLRFHFELISEDIIMLMIDKS